MTGQYMCPHCGYIIGGGLLFAPDQFLPCLKCGRNTQWKPVDDHNPAQRQVKKYRIVRMQTGVRAYVNNKPLDPRTDLWNHSPDGFEVGYCGSGPAQLALAILADCLGDQDNLAIRLHQRFKFDVIAKLSQKKQEHTLTSDDVMRFVGDYQLAGLQKEKP